MEQGDRRVAIGDGRVYPRSSRGDDASQVAELKASGKEGLVVVYAPWCQFCQAMEENYGKLAEASGLATYKFRGDEEREFVQVHIQLSIACVWMSLRFQVDGYNQPKP